MRRGKTICCQLALSAILLAGCAVLLVGAAWARYQTREEIYLEYEVKEFPGVYLWSLDESGALSEEAAVWAASAGGWTMDFYITNGLTAEDAAQGSQQVYIRLLGALGLPEEAEVTLTVDGETYSAAAQQIKEGTLLYQNFGPGQMFCFLDEDGNEPSWMLEGGGLSILTAQLEVQGEITDTTLLQLQVWGEQGT